MAEHRFLSLWLARHIDPEDMGALGAIDAHLDTAERAADGSEPKRLRRLWATVNGASVERARSQLDAAESELLRLAPDSYLLGQLPSLVAHVRSHLDKDDPRRIAIEAIHKRVADRAARRSLAEPTAAPMPPETALSPADRDVIVTAVRNASAQGRREVTRVRSFRNLLLVSALFLSIGLATMVAVGATHPEVIPLCFNPEGMVVCPTEDRPAPGQSGASGGTAAPEQPTPEERAEVDDVVRDTANAWDVPLVALIGFLAAALAAATALRGIKGTSTEYSLPVALAVLKLPSGALTAVLGLLLMRGDFVPGLSALDSPAQIVAWAIVFGYAQQLLTRLVDQRAQGVLADVAPGDPAPGRSSEPPAAPA